MDSPFSNLKNFKIMSDAVLLDWLSSKQNINFRFRLSFSEPVVLGGLKKMVNEYLDELQPILAELHANMDKGLLPEEYKKYQESRPCMKKVCSKMEKLRKRHNFFDELFFDELESLGIQNPYKV